MNPTLQKYAKIDKYVLTKTLGAGYNAKVKLSSFEGKQLAIKIFKSTHTLA